MPTVQVAAELSQQSLLHAVEQLGDEELERFFAQILRLRGRRRGPTLPSEEAELLLKINQGIPDEHQARFQSLCAKRQSENLSREEHDELLVLTEEIEQHDAERVKLLAELACLRGMTLSALLEQLDMGPGRHEG